MKKRTTIFMLLLMLMTTTFFGCGNSPDEVTVESEEEEIIDYVNEILINSDNSYESFFGEENPFVIGERYFEVNRQDDIFFINNNGEKSEFEVAPKGQKEEELEFIDIKEIDLEISNIVSSSKEKVCKFVEQAGFFEEEDDVIAKLNEVEIKLTDSEYTAFYYDRHKTIYIGDKDSVCEWMLVHEYIHALAAITNENQRYAFYMYNEIFTDIITASMNPEIPAGVSSQYLQFDLVVYNFIHVFKEDAIKAYFYGYDEIIETTSEEELDMFVEVVENLEGGTKTEDYYRNLILKWSAAEK